MKMNDIGDMPIVYWKLIEDYEGSDTRICTKCKEKWNSHTMKYRDIDFVPIVE